MIFLNVFILYFHCFFLIFLNIYIDNFESDEDENRRIYKMPHLKIMNHWDDLAFFRRFRMTKPTFEYILSLI